MHLATSFARLVLALGFGIAVTMPASAANQLTAYKWTDANGVIHYGEAPPTDRAAQRIDLEPVPAPVEAVDYHSILKQAQRMERQRLERERQRAAQHAARLEAERAAAQQAAALAAAEFYQQQAQQPPVIYLPRLHPHKGHHRLPRHRRPEPIPEHYSGRHPAFTPPSIWLRSHPRLWRKELRAQRDYNPRRDQ